jgi:mannose-6-phosphate isomerase-like protein (cupin superfamily)
VIGRDVAEHYTWGDGCDGWHLVKRADLSVIHERMPAGASEVRHYHRAARQFFFVLSGVLTLELEGRAETLVAQHGLEIPPGTAHRARNASPEPVEFLVVSMPPSHGDRVAAP